MVGEVENDGGVLVVRRIHVTYTLSGVQETQRETVERVLGFHADKCPVARSIRDSISVTTSLRINPDTQGAHTHQGS
ncbi:hypothetical protein BMS3Abin02_00461 [bacterium BMS3Abin02]|nr:hypothetical protein BMS3Abin02_00461 [bacterium BMS3Abin02]GBE21859.1 hypothetical protein BMS3Bbin01_01211 [bacterium BMS3Bbin01]